MITKPAPASSEEAELRKIRKILILMSVLFVPMLFVGFGLSTLLDSEVALTVVAAPYLLTMVLYSVKAFVAYYRVTGKYPFYWMFK